MLAPRTRTNRYSGEDAYTDALLAAPPCGVEYVHYDDLIARGEARRARWVHRLLPRLEKALRGTFWVESCVSDETFDLIHLHGFSGYLGGRMARSGAPVLLSESSSALENLIDYDGWDRGRLRRFARGKRLVMRAARIYDPTLNLRDARGLTVWSAWAKDLHLPWGVPERLISVIPPPVGDVGRAAPGEPHPGPPHFLFVGMDFVRKNGPLVLEAFRAARPDLPGARLTVVGGRDSDLNDHAAGVTHIAHLPRERLFAEQYPQADALFLPSRAEGYGISVAEAMSAGLPCVVSGFGALPEIVGESGIVVEPVTAEGLRQAMLTLGTDARRRKAMGCAARERFERCWSRPATTGALGDLYGRIAAGGRA